LRGGAFVTGAAVGLVLLSAVAHASWNFLTKRAQRPEVFTWWLAAAGNLVTLPLAIFLLATRPPTLEGWGFVFVTWFLHVGYYAALSRGYREGDLSLVYPLARGSGLLLVALSGAWILGESVSWTAAFGIAAVVVGVLALSWTSVLGGALRQPLRLLGDPGVRYALLTGVMIAAYSTVDKRGVEHVTPLLYSMLLTTSGWVGLYPVISRRHAPAAFVEEFCAAPWAILAAGVLQIAAYSLVLAAFQVSRVSYVGPFREIGLVFGAVLGAALLAEPFARLRIAGAATIAAGAIIIALAP
jgi:drug/metabolite transporter (DMT)-like permease